MPEAGADAYLKSWRPRAYLRQYYDTPRMAEDERANVAFALVRFRDFKGRFGRAIEVGCGPTIHHAAFLAPHVGELHLADYLAANLDELRLWLDDEPGAHDWGAYLAGLVEVEDAGGSASERASLLRRQVTRLLEIDLRGQMPSGMIGHYDLVASYYCAECVSGDRDEWRRCLAGIASLIAPGGALLLGALRRCRAYRVFEDTFPTAFVDEADFLAELPGLGFDPSKTIIEPVLVEEWLDQGFDGICRVWAVKSAGSPRGHD